MPGITCSEVQVELDAFRTGELPLAKMRQIDRHLSECTECAHAWENLVGLSLRLGELCSLPPVAVSPSARSKPSKRKWALRVAATAAAVWLLACTALVLSPSLARRFSALPVGGALRASATQHTQIAASSQANARLRYLLTQSLLNRMPSDARRSLIQYVQRRWGASAGHSLRKPGITLPQAASLEGLRRGTGPRQLVVTLLTTEGGMRPQEYWVITLARDAGGRWSVTAAFQAEDAPPAPTD